MSRTAIALSVVLAGNAGAQGDEAVPSSTYTHPQRLITVEAKRRLNVFCLGNGSPTVLLDAGAGENMMVWRHVQRQIASVTRACAYDRAGYGFSDPADHASDARNAASDIHRIISVALSAPVVYVGHSISGLYGAMVVAKYPRDIAGLVLVDPAFSHSFEITSATYTPAERAQLSNRLVQGIAQIRGCLTLARKGTLSSPLTNAAASCVDTKGYAEPLDDTLRREMRRQNALAKVYGAALSEYGNAWPISANLLGVDDRQLDAAGVNFGGRPLVVLTRGNPQPPVPGIAPSHTASGDSAWANGHAVLARTSTRGTHVVVPNSGHHIQFDQPAAVIDAVLNVVAEVRAATRPLADSLINHP